MSTQQKSTKQKIVHIDGMTCTGCANTIQEAFESKEGVTEATVDLEKNTASDQPLPFTINLLDWERQHDKPTITEV